VNDNRPRLATRVRQLRTGLRHAQSPPSPMRRLLSNLEYEREGDGYRVAGNFVLYEHAVQAGNRLRIWSGRVTYGVRRREGELRMRRKVVELVNAADALPSLAFLI
jgi:3-phenylpropionate/cinnamic acid dioxygenase small subunit